MKILLDVDVDRLRVFPQKVYYGSETDRHGTRLDVYLEEDGGAGTVYDVEPDKNDSTQLKKSTAPACQVLSFEDRWEEPEAVPTMEMRSVEVADGTMELDSLLCTLPIGYNLIYFMNTVRQHFQW